MIEIKLDASAWDGAQDDAHALLEKWLIAEPEHVKKGQALVTVVMVKATIEIEAPSDGYIEKILLTQGDSFAIGTVLANFTSSSEVVQ